MRQTLWILLGVLAGCLAGCGSGEPQTPLEGGVPIRAEKEADSPTRPDEAAPLVVFLGDSLTAGYGLAEKEAFPALVAERLRAAGRPIRFVNAGVSGDTSVGGERRLQWLLDQGPDVLVVELGANDGLRGLAVDLTRATLDAIVTRARDHGVRVLLVGMKVPPNYGPVYSRDFELVFEDLAREREIALVPFLLEGVGGRRDLNLADGIHPTAEGHQFLADNVYPHLEALLTDLQTTGL